MNNEHVKYARELEWLLDGEEDSDGLAAARTKLLRDPDLRAEFESLRQMGAALAEVGDAVHQQAGTIDIQDDVHDAIVHHAMEELSVVNASPYQDFEHAFRDLKDAFDARAGEVSLVGDVMAAVAASRLPDVEVEQPFADVAGHLNGLGDALHAHTPEVELVEPVMAGVRAPANVVPMRARPAVAHSTRVPADDRAWIVYFSRAAAAVLCIGAAWFAYVSFQGAKEAGPRVAGSDQSTTTGQDPREMASGHDDVVAALPDVVSENGNAPAPLDGETEPRVRVADSGKEPLTLQEVINERRRDLVRGTQQMAALASLTEEEAIQLLKDMDLSLEALIGATQFLSTEEAIAVLRAAIAEHPDDPNLLYALARNLDSDPAFADERLQHLNQMAAADPQNGLPHYMLAADYFARGEMGLGLDELSRGSSYAESSAYTLESARQREAALIASGLDANVARFLALNTSGNQEYTDIASLRNELLEYGAYYEGLEDYDTAEQIYNAVNQLGVQLTDGADMLVEQQYGYETQEQALLAIQGLAEILQQPEAIALLGETLGALASGIADVTQYISARQELIVNPALSSQVDWDAFMQHVIFNGDLEVSRYLPRRQQ